MLKINWFNGDFVCPSLADTRDVDRALILITRVIDKFVKCSQPIARDLISPRITMDGMPLHDIPAGNPNSVECA